ncbi:MAG: radical SAM protein [Elusimicrobiota bacterium]
MKISMKTLEAVEKYDWPYHRTKVCELTLNYDCNARCVFCYSSPEMDEWKNKNRLDIKTAASYMNNSYKTGSRVLQIIGGEPTVYPNLSEIIKIAKKIGYPVIQIVTNGQRASDFNYLKNLKYAGLNSITFSIHAPDKKLHDSIVGVKGAFSKIIKALENAVKLDIYPSVGTAVNALNYKQIPALVKFLYDRYNMESYHIIAMHFIGAAGKNEKKLSVSYSQTLPYIKEALKFLSSKRIMPISALLSNYQPCLLPGCENIISDWKIPFCDDDLYLPEKVYKDSMYSMITDTLRMKGVNCEKCIYSGICAGFERRYYDIYGDKEFKPLKSAAKPISMGVFYSR